MMFIEKRNIKLDFYFWAYEKGVPILIDIEQSKHTKMRDEEMSPTYHIVTEFSVPVLRIFG